MDMTKLGFILLAVVTVTCLFYALVYPYLSGEARVEKRHEAIAGGDAARIMKTERQSAAHRRDQIASSLKELDDKQKGKAKLTLEKRIHQAGLEWDKKQYFVFCGVVGILFGLLAIVATREPLIALPTAIVAGAGIPLWVLSFLAKRRIKKFIDDFPNAIDVIVRGIKAGLPLNDCLRMIAVEAKEPVRGEFQQIIEAQAIGLPTSEAIAKLTERIPIAEANFFAIVIAIQSKTGGNLSDALGNLSRVLRERKKMKGKISAMSMEAKASAAVIGSMPIIVTGVLFLSSPDYVILLFTTEMGRFAVLGSLVLMGIGIAMMKKMISFDF